MTGVEAEIRLRDLAEHFGEPVLPASEYCTALREWAKVSGLSADVLTQVDLAIGKSCLLSRTIYGGEKMSQTPCPVHKGTWAGIHAGWPGMKWTDGKPAEVHKTQQEWYDKGCRCFMHKGCSCTTGWQPDEACGCGVKP